MQLNIGAEPNIQVVGFLRTPTAVNIIGFPVDIHCCISDFLSFLDIIFFTSVNKKFYNLRNNAYYTKFLSKRRLTSVNPIDNIFHKLIYLNIIDDKDKLIYAIKNGYEQIIYRSNYHFDDIHARCKMLTSNAYYYIQCCKLKFSYKDMTEIDISDAEKCLHDYLEKRPDLGQKIKDKISTFKVYQLCHTASTEQEKLGLLQMPDYDRYVRENKTDIFAVANADFLKLVGFDISTKKYNDEILSSKNLELIKYAHENKILDNTCSPIDFDSTLTLEKYREYRELIHFLFINRYLRTTWVLIRNIFLANDLLLFKGILELYSPDYADKIRACEDLYDDLLLMLYMQIIKKKDLYGIMIDLVRNCNLTRTIKFIRACPSGFWAKNKKKIINNSLKFGDIQLVDYLLKDSKIEVSMISANAIAGFFVNTRSMSDVRYIINLMKIDNLNKCNIDNLVRHLIRLHKLDDLIYLFTTFKITSRNRVLLLKTLTYAKLRGRYSISNYVSTNYKIKEKSE